MEHDPDAERWEMEAERQEPQQVQMHLARMQGDAFGAAVEQLAVEALAVAPEQRLGDYWVGCVIRPCEGAYEWVERELTWRAPAPGEVTVDITVRDAGDGRFVPAVGVSVTVLDETAGEVGCEEHPLVWHPALFTYGRAWPLYADRRYTLRVSISPPAFQRHDEINGRRLSEPVTVEFDGLRVTRTT